MYISTFHIIAYDKVEAEVSSSQPQSGPDNINDKEIISHVNEDLSSPNKGKLCAGATETGEELPID